MNDLQISHIGVTFGRKVNPAQYESANLEVVLDLTPGLSPSDELDIVLRDLERKVESQLAANSQRRQWYTRFFGALMKVHVPAEDAEQALAALKLPYPRTIADYQVVITAVEDLRLGGLASLPDEWLWFRDGKHPHPRLNAPAPETNQESEPLQDDDPSPVTE